MSVSAKEIAWLAGVLEGEGSFGLTNKGKSPAIWLGMTDSDIVERVRVLIDPSKSISLFQDIRKEGYKTSYRITFNGSRAVEWMMTIYPLMSVRRKAKIKECLLAWKEHEVDIRYINSPLAKAKRSLTNRLQRMGESAENIEIAGALKSAGFSDQQILEKLEQLKITSMKTM
jgi:hypothetical protein